MDADDIQVEIQVPPPLGPPSDHRMTNSLDQNLPPEGWTDCGWTCITSHSYLVGTVSLIHLMGCWYSFKIGDNINPFST